MRSFCVTIFTLIFLFGALSHVQAQMLDTMMNGTISIQLSPQIPAPGEEVQATLDDYSITATGATIRWSYDGEAQPQLNNQRTISLIAPAVGESAELTVSLTYQNGQSLESTTTIRPLYLDVIVEPYTYTPPFYKGRALPIYGSQVQLTALLQDANGPVNAANYTYTWRLNNQAVGGGGARGKFQNLITIPYGRNQLLSIEVQDETSRTVAKRIVLVPVSEIDIQFYENNPLYGLSRKAITNNYNLISNTTSVTAVPYNHDLNAFNGSLFTEWRINNQRVSTASNPFEITLSRQGTGSTRVSFKLRNTMELLQSDDHSVTINF